MKPVRLLPVVMLAIAALLVFKTIGLVTSGGYVLGPAPAEASETGGAPALDAASPDTAPAEPTLVDTNPVLQDTAPTLGDAKADGDGHGAPAAASKTAHAAQNAAAANAAEAAPGGSAIADTGTTSAVPDARAAAMAAATAMADAACPPLPVMADTTPDVSATEIPAAQGGSDGHGEGKAAPADPTSSTHANPNCDPLAEGVPTMIDATGKPVPMTTDSGASLTDKTLLERLSQRRAELDAYASQLDMRQSLVQAAEQKIGERTATLQGLEDQIGKLVDQRKDQEAGQFASIVTMYENMKPKDAAAIFDNLEMSVLLPVAKAMNPRKMSPILAAMSAQRAQDLTVAMASSAATPAETMTPQDVSALPQIVGK